MPNKKKQQQELEEIDIYDEDYVEELLEDDEISAAEEGFMMGYNKS